MEKEQKALEEAQAEAYQAIPEQVHEKAAEIARAVLSTPPKPLRKSGKENRILEAGRGFGYLAFKTYQGEKNGE